MDNETRVLHIAVPFLCSFNNISFYFAAPIFSASSTTIKRPVCTS